MKDTLDTSGVDLEKSLVEAGFAIVAVYGGWEGEGYNDDSEEMIFLAQKRSGLG